MKKTISWISVIILLINAIGALFGGYELMADPTGIRMQMPISLLNNSPFSNYFIPGLILFIANGLCSILTIVILLTKNKFRSYFVLAQGMILIGWIIIEIILLRFFYTPLHLPFLLMGLILIVCGLFLLKTKN